MKGIGTESSPPNMMGMAPAARMAAAMPLPTVDTAVAHCEAAMDFALG